MPKQPTTTVTHDDQAVLSTAECAEVIIETVAQLRTEAGLSADQDISIYVTDAQLIRSTLTERGDYIREKTHAIDLVRTNVKAGIPMPAHLPQKELHSLNDGPATIAIEESK
ncbi:MAG: hypothetical protein KF832_09140 [Caldilineaceae bacterium]|nr:hypothetical protein [Caldilineaceae bacterium]